MGSFRFELLVAGVPKVGGSCPAPACGPAHSRRPRGVRKQGGGVLAASLPYFPLNTGKWLCSP